MATVATPPPVEQRDRTRATAGEAGAGARRRQGAPDAAYATAVPSPAAPRSAVPDDDDKWFATAMVIGAIAMAGMFLLILLMVSLNAARRGEATQTARPAAGAAGAATFEVVASEFSFRPDQLRVGGLGEVTITLQNKGMIEHDMVLEGVDGKVHAAAGQTARGVFSLTKPGTYTFFCSIPGHKDAGMKGTLVVGNAIVGTSAAQSAPAAARGAAPTGAAAAAPAAANARPLPQPLVTPPVNREALAAVHITIETKEVTATLADGVTYTFWTFGGTVPGPMLRVRQGDTVELTLKNAPDSKVTHSINLHAVTGPGGGARATQVPPGGWPKVDREYYVTQGDFSIKGARGQASGRVHQEFSLEKLLDERPDYLLFNGGVGALSGEQALRATVGETVRIFFGVGGPNLTSSFQVIGEIFDRVWPESASEPLTNVQTTLVPRGGAAVVGFKVEVPGSYILVDHSLGRLEKGAVGFLEVSGPDAPAIFQPLAVGSSGTGGH